MKGRRAVCALALLSCGCSGIPFRDSTRVAVDGSDPWALSRRYGERVPVKFNVLNSVVFNYNLLRRMSALGIIDVDTGEGKFAVAVFSPLGVKLFELASSGERIETRYVIGFLGGKGDVAGAVGGDIKRVYFDLIPSPKAKVKVKKYSVVFEEKAGKGLMRRVFAGPGGNLIRKEFFERGDLVWRVAYYEYREVDGKLFPGGVVMDNFKRGYRLIIKLKEVYRDAQNQP